MALSLSDGAKKIVDFCRWKSERLRFFALHPFLSGFRLAFLQSDGKSLPAPALGATDDSTRSNLLSNRQTHPSESHRHLRSLPLNLQTGLRPAEKAGGAGAIRCAYAKALVNHKPARHKSPGLLISSGSFRRKRPLPLPRPSGDRRAGRRRSKLASSSRRRACRPSARTPRRRS